MSGWSWLWFAEGLLVGLTELYALLRARRGDTLSEQIWLWLHVEPGVTPPKAALYSFRTLTVAVPLLWLFFHFTFGWWA